MEEIQTPFKSMEIYWLQQSQDFSTLGFKITSLDMY